MDYQQGAVFPSFFSTYTPIEYINEASCVPSPPKTGRPRETIDGFDNLRRQLVHVSCERVVHRSRRNHRHGFLFPVLVNNFCRRRWCVWELAHFTDDPPPEAVTPLLEATSLWDFASLFMRAQSLGIPNVLEDAWGPGCVWPGVLPGAKAPRDDVTMWWNRVNIVPNEPKCPVPGCCCADLTEVSGTGSGVVPIPAPARCIRAYRYRRYWY